MARKKSSPRTPDSSAKGQKSRVLLYSPSQKSLEDYTITFDGIGMSYDTVDTVQDAKRLLQTGAYQTFLADVSGFDSQGYRLLVWARNHISNVFNFRSLGITLSNMPNIVMKVYRLGSDQRFLLDHDDINHLTDVMSSLFMNHTDIEWVNELREARKRLKDQIENAKPTMNPVLLKGDKGICKECLAQIVHCMCDRSQKHFILLDCNPSQRFDYVAADTLNMRPNLDAIEQNLKTVLGMAVGGTVFFKSFSHMPMRVQGVLYKVLKKGDCICPNTGETIPFTGRIIFATNKPLSDLAEEKILDARLYKMAIRNLIDVKPIACYPKDLVPLANGIVEYMCLKSRGRVMEFTEEAKSIIREYPWTGNLTEMYAVLDMAVSTAFKLKITARDLSIAPPEPVDEKTLIETLLSKHNGNHTRALKEFGKSRGYFYKKLKEYGLGTYRRNEDSSKQELLDA